jgi:peptidoglycan hydrolase-like protein with peptidoglycan-binding domain
MEDRTVAISRDLMNTDIWVTSLERSLTRRGRPRRASLELGKLRPPRDLSDPDNLVESVVYWRARRAASGASSMPAAGGASALALLAATTIPALAAGSHSGSGKSSLAKAKRGGGGSAPSNAHIVKQTVSSAKPFSTGSASVTHGTVAGVQRMLGLTPDGVLGAQTAAAIRAFQTSHGLTVDGVVGAATWNAMKAAATTAGGSNDGLAHTAVAHAADAQGSGGAAAAPDTVASTVSATTTAGTSVQATAASAADANAQTTPAITVASTAAATTTTAATAAPAPTGVGAVQEVLHVPVDGTYGPATKTAVAAFQSSHGLAADGVVGPDTRAALGIGAGPTLQYIPPPPPLPTPFPVANDTAAASSPAAATTPAQSTSTASAPADSSSTENAPSTTTSAEGDPSNVAAGMAEMIAAANQIATLPYIWGGGHGSFVSPGYDCSGSVSYVLHAAGLLSAPEDSSELESYGAPGPGRYITIYASGGHAWMTIDGQRFDTVALSDYGTRWASGGGEFDGFVERHPVGY